jgi:hypothetical protein
MTVMTSRGLSMRATVRGLGLSRSIEHYTLKQPGKDAGLSGRIQDVSQQFPRFGDLRVAAWLNVGGKRVWRLKVADGPGAAPASATATTQR